MNGAVTLGTLDGANVEIRDLVGDENCVIFGLTEEEVKRTKKSGYNAYDYYDHDPEIRRIMDSLSDGTWSNNPNDFKEILEEFRWRNDEYMVLADYHSYLEAHYKVYELYQDRHAWAKKCLINIAKSAYFSADRTIEEYVEDIWHIEKI
jgi:starch phosphorylase